MAFSIRLTEEERNLADSYAKLHSMSMGEAFKRALFERIEDEWYVTLDHPMRKDHFISFIAYVSTGGVTIQKLYPEQEAAARFRVGMSGVIYAYCNRHGLFSVRTPRRR